MYNLFNSLKNFSFDILKTISRAQLIKKLNKYLKNNYCIFFYKNNNWGWGIFCQDAFYIIKFFIPYLFFIFYFNFSKKLVILIIIQSLKFSI